MSKVFVDQASARAADLFAASDRFQITNNQDQAELVWLRKNYRRSYGRLGAHQSLNHVPGEDILSRKGNLTNLLNNRLHLADGAGYTPRAFYQPSWNLSDFQQRHDFLAQLPAEDTEGNLWIMKPSQLSRGVGVKVLWQTAELREQLARSTTPTIEVDGEHRHYIIQRYIRDLLLLRERKSEIRVYWLIASVNPLRVYMYPEGTVRFTAHKFKLGDYDNPLIHLTNTYQQKQHDQFNPDEVLKWDFAELDRYVAEELGLADAGWLQRALLPKVAQALAYVARSAEVVLQHAHPEQGHYFALFGADFIIDRHLTPWLAEVQKGPGLVYNDPVKRQVIPPMFHEAMAIVLEQRGLLAAAQPNAVQRFLRLV